MNDVKEDYTVITLIDGIDEKNIGAEEQADTFNKIITDVKDAKNIKVILTSRYLRWLDESNLLEGEISRYHLPHLSLNKTIDFLLKVCKKLTVTDQIYFKTYLEVL